MQNAQIVHHKYIHQNKFSYNQFRFCFPFQMNIAHMFRLHYLLLLKRTGQTQFALNK